MIHRKNSFFHLMSFLLSESRYNIINIPLIYKNINRSTDHVTLAFDDAGENVWVAGIKMSSTDMETIVNDVKEIIHDSVDIPIRINAILVSPLDDIQQIKHITYKESEKLMNTNTDDSYIAMFESIEDADEYLQGLEKTPMEDLETVEAATAFYEKIVEYLNKNNTYTESPEKLGMARLHAMAKKHNISGHGIGVPDTISIPENIEEIVANELGGSNIEQEWVAATQKFLNSYLEEINGKEITFREYWSSITPAHSDMPAFQNITL